jgi:hypothetical protein
MQPLFLRAAKAVGRRLNDSPAIGAAKDLAKMPISKGAAALESKAPRLYGGAKTFGNKISKSNKLKELSLQMRRNAPGALWKAAGGGNIPILDNMFSKWDSKRVSRIDRYLEIRAQRAESDKQKFEKQKSNQVNKSVNPSKNSGSDSGSSAQTQSDAVSGNSGASGLAQSPSLALGQSDAEVSFLSRISEDISQLKNYFFKRGSFCCDNSSEEKGKDESQDKPRYEIVKVQDDQSKPHIEIVKIQDETNKTKNETSESRNEHLKKQGEHHPELDEKEGGKRGKLHGKLGAGFSFASEIVEKLGHFGLINHEIAESVKIAKKTYGLIKNFKDAALKAAGKEHHEAIAKNAANSVKSSEEGLKSGADDIANSATQNSGSKPGRGLFSRVGNKMLGRVGNKMLGRAGTAVAGEAGAAAAGETLPFILSALALYKTGSTAYDIGSFINKKLDGTKIGNVRDSFFDTIFSGIDKITGGAITGTSGLNDLNDKLEKENSKKFVRVKKEAKSNSDNQIPDAQQKFRRSEILYENNQNLKDSSGVENKQVAQLETGTDGSKRLEDQQKNRQIEKTNQDLKKSIDDNTEATNKTIKPLETISSPDWLHKLGDWISGAFDWIKNSKAGQFSSNAYNAVKNRTTDAIEAVSNSKAGQFASNAYNAVKNSSVGQAVSNAYESVKGWVLGSTSKQFETSGKGAGTISSGEGDRGGKSYGSYQMTGDALKQFVTSGPYADQFKGLALKSNEFDAKWKELAEKDPNFGQAQHDFIKQTHFDPQQQKLLKSGIDLRNRGAAVQDAIWSTSVQFGGNTDLIKNALAGKDASKMSDADIVSAIQDYKIKNNESLFRSSAPNIRVGTLKRENQEKQALLKLANDPDLANVSSTQIASAGAPSSSDKLSSAAQASVGDVVAAQTMETEKAEKQAAQPIVVGTAAQPPASCSAAQSGTTNTASAPMVTRNQDSSIRRITDGMMSYGLT